MSIDVLCNIYNSNCMQIWYGQYSDMIEDNCATKHNQPPMKLLMKSSPLKISYFFIDFCRTICWKTVPEIRNSRTNTHIMDLLQTLHILEFYVTMKSSLCVTDWDSHLTLSGQPIGFSIFLAQIVISHKLWTHHYVSHHSDNLTRTSRSIPIIAKFFCLSGHCTNAPTAPPYCNSSWTPAMCKNNPSSTLTFLLWWHHSSAATIVPYPLCHSFDTTTTPHCTSEPTT